MSLDYVLQCKKCGCAGGDFDDNAQVDISTLLFMLYHTYYCGKEFKVLYWDEDDAYLIKTWAYVPESEKNSKFKPGQALNKKEFMEYISEDGFPFKSLCLYGDIKRLEMTNYLDKSYFTMRCIR